MSHHYLSNSLCLKTYRVKRILLIQETQFYIQRELPFEKVWWLRIVLHRLVVGHHEVPFKSLGKSQILEFIFWLNVNLLFWERLLVKLAQNLTLGEILYIEFTKNTSLWKIVKLMLLLRKNVKLIFYDVAFLMLKISQSFFN